MPIKCCVSGCKTYSGHNIKVHRFPHLDEDLYNEWIKRVGNEKLQNLHPITVNKLYYVCDVHFSDYSRIPSNYKHRSGLKHRSVPTLYLPGFTGEPTEENSRLPYHSAATS